MSSPIRGGPSSHSSRLQQSTPRALGASESQLAVWHHRELSRRLARLWPDRAREDEDRLIRLDNRNIRGSACRWTRRPSLCRIVRTARATGKARHAAQASRRRDGVMADSVTAEMQSRGYLSPKRSAAGLQLLSGHQGVSARCCALLPPSPPWLAWHQLPLERGAAHEPDEPRLSPSNGDKDRPRGLAIGHNFRPPAPAIGQKMLLAQDRAQAQRPACDPTGQTTS